MLKGKNVLNYLKTIQIFGLSKLNDPFFNLEENQILYKAGHNIVRYHTSLKIQDIITCSTSSASVDSVCVNDKKDQFLVAESGEKECSLSIFMKDQFKLKKKLNVRKTLGFDKNSKKECLRIIRWVAEFRNGQNGVLKEKQGNGAGAAQVQ